MSQTTSDKGYAVLKSFEGRALRAYKCPANVWTIGYGQTSHDIAAIRQELGDPNFTISAGAKITEEQANRLLKMSVTTRYEPACRTALKGKVNQPAFDAAVDFHFNCGAISRASWVKSFVAGNLSAAHSQLLSWNKGGGRVLSGLVRRRNREWEMITRSDYGPEGRNAPPMLGGPNGKVVGTVVEAPKGPGMLELGDSGPEVKELQVALNKSGLGPTAPDTPGSFGENTKKAVEKLQKAHPQLDVDGRVGPATRAVLERDASMKKQSGATTAAGTVAEAATGTVDVAAGASLPTSVYVILGLVFVAGLCYIGWKYRDELVAKFKAKMGS